MIPQSFIEEVQSRTDIVELISSYIPVKRAGRNFKASCPFHQEKTPSFMISPQKQIFHCFGCGEGGGAFQFLTLIEKLSFPEVVEMLAKRAGLVVPYSSDKSAESKTVLYEAVKAAADFFHDNLTNGKKYQAIRDYLEKRGIKEKTISKFYLGYAPGGSALMNHLRAAGFTLENLEKSSLVTSTRSGFCDLFRDRITFPISDIRSRIIGFGARTYKPADSSPKYMNSLENVLYSKRSHLYGLNFSRDGISKAEKSIVVEGYLDMIIPFMGGVANIVASLGTALTHEQIRLLKRHTSYVILMYDSDKAGQAATLRSIDLLLENDLRVGVVDLPLGDDPDSLARKNGRDFFLRLVDKAKDFFEYKLNILKKSYDSDSIEGKTKIAKELLATIDKLNSEVKKYEYIKKLSSSLGIKEEIMIAEYKNNFGKSNQAARGEPQEVTVKMINNLANEPLSVTEKVVIKFMLTNPKAAVVIKDNLGQEHFKSYLVKKTVNFLFGILPLQNKSIQSILGEIRDKEISSFISKILIDDDIPLDKETIKKSILKLQKKNAEELKKKLNIKIKEADKKGDRTRLRELMGQYQKIDGEVRNV